jgi:hypothetical protein
MNPPNAVRDYDISLAISDPATRGQFRWREMEGDALKLDHGQPVEWFCTSIAGAAYCVGDGVEPAHLRLRCTLVIESATAWAYTPDAVPDDLDGCRIVEQRPDSHYRLCAIVPNQLQAAMWDGGSRWRLRDERQPPETTTLHRSYVGPVTLNWLDGGPHFFHDGPVAIDAENRVHFIT